MPKISRCEVHKTLVLKMISDDCSLKEIGRAVGTTGNRVKDWVLRNGIDKKFPKAGTGSKNSNWKGGRRPTAAGYVLIYAPNHPHSDGCYVWEHRLVMEKMIGRILLPKEVVHHRNGKKGDNRPENLQLFSENRQHLAHELKGRIPKWTPDGLARMKKGVEKAANVRRGKTRDQIKQHAGWLR